MKRIKIEVKGIVQGVGFRPFIYSLAHKYNLKGFVLNNSNGVIIDVEGEEGIIEKFISDIKKKAPPLSRIKNMDIKKLHLVGYEKFTIKPSSSKEEKFVLISPDIGTCDKCLQELFDPNDRRFHYPFINCTNCGPRFTIIKAIPYDRPKTTMDEFKMCSRCKKEYEDFLNRRFHAQPNACSDCGPKVELINSQLKAEKYGEDAIIQAAKLLKEGKVVAIKGLGGFHIACDATNPNSVKRLREVKRRDKKPFAMMAKDIQTIFEFCEVSEVEKIKLLSPHRPILILKKKRNNFIADNVAPGQKYYGVMLPYTPLHYLLLEEFYLQNPRLPVLVMTSANLSDEPILYKEEEIFTKFKNIYDYFVTHNRKIYIRCDDSVIRCFEDKELMIRRSRGYVPEPIELPFSIKHQVLACGAELKNTFCVTKNGYAFLSHHIGDLESLESFIAFKEGIEHFKHLFSIEPTLIAYDIHPHYLSTKYALDILDSELNIEGISVQHHHAHIASCMADNQIQDKVIGVAFDGLGYGTDGNLWGGEFLITDYSDFKRVGRFQYIQMPGGTQAIKEPWRMACSWLWHIYRNDALKLEIEFIKSLDKEKWDVLKNLIIHRINAPLTSSVGRLFDAVSALLGICKFTTYEGEAAIELETIVDEISSPPYKYELFGKMPNIIIKPELIFVDIIKDLKNKVPVNRISARFHATIIDIVVKMCSEIRKDTGIERVALSGGVFQNMLLLHGVVRKLRNKKFKVYIPSRVPINDGGISFGQAVIASYKAQKQKG